MHNLLLKILLLLGKLLDLGFLVFQVNKMFFEDLFLGVLFISHLFSELG
jgi:hypothetical protein